MPVRVQHESLQEERIGIVLLSPTIVANLLEGLAHSAADAEIPAVSSQGNVLQRIPKVLSKRCILQKAPVFVFAQESVSANRFGGTRGLARLSPQNGDAGGQNDDPRSSGSHGPISLRLRSGSRRCIRRETVPSQSFFRRLSSARPGPRRLRLWLLLACPRDSILHIQSSRDHRDREDGRRLRALQSCQRPRKSGLGGRFP